MSALRRNNVHVRGTGDRAIVFAHGFGCDQYVWQHLAPAFEREFVTVLFDHVGCGSSQRPAYSSSRYCTLDAFGEDLVEIGGELNLKHAVLVGHSFGAMVGALASLQKPGLFDQLVLLAPNARYLNDTNYNGGYSARQVQQMLDFIETDYGAWSSRMAPLAMGNPEHPQLASELVESFKRQDPEIAGELARVIFRSDLRATLRQVKTEALVLHTEHDLVVPFEASRDVHLNIHGSELKTLEVRGHFPHISAPVDTVAAVSQFLRRSTCRSPVPERFNVVRRLVREGTRTLGIVRPASDRPALKGDDEAIECLLTRTGELWMHLGRYDMYAFTLQRLLVPDGSVVEEARTLRTRGQDIHRRLLSLSNELASHFEETERELFEILDRSEPAASYGATVPGLRAPLPPDSAHGSKAWFDQVNATFGDLSAQGDRTERDILKVVALCFRLCHCALAVQRLLRYEQDLQERPVVPNHRPPLR